MLWDAEVLQGLIDTLERTPEVEQKVLVLLTDIHSKIKDAEWQGKKFIEYDIYTGHKQEDKVACACMARLSMDGYLVDGVHYGMASDDVSFPLILKTLVVRWDVESFVKSATATFEYKAFIARRNGEKEINFNFSFRKLTDQKVISKTVKGIPGLSATKLADGTYNIKWRKT